MNQTSVATTSDSLADRCQAEASVLQEIWNSMHARLEKSGFTELSLGAGDEFGMRELRRDPFDGSEALYSEWRGLDGRRIGNALIRADGNIYAELDVIQPHPTDARWFVEGVSAWGSKGNIKTELKLLPALGA